MWNFKNLKVVQESRTLVKAVYEATTEFPRSELFGLSGQIRRSAISIGSNIVEGSGRSSPADFARFLDAAVASAAECQYQLQLAADLGFLKPRLALDLIDKADKVGKMTSRLRRRILESGPSQASIVDSR